MDKRGRFITIAILGFLTILLLIIVARWNIKNSFSKETLPEVEKPKEKSVMNESIEEKSCVDECSSEICDGFAFYECVLQEDGCKDKVSKGIIKDKCGVECLSDSDCQSGWGCSNYECKFVPLETELDINILSVGIAHISSPSISASTLYSNRNLIRHSNSSTNHFTSFVVSNKGKSIAKNVILKRKIEGYTDWDVVAIGDIKAAESYTDLWNPVVSESILNVNEAKDVAVNMVVTYSDEQDQSYKKEKTAYFKLLNKNTQDCYTNYAQFVTPSDSVVKDFVSAVANGSSSTKDEIDNMVQQIWGGLTAYGISYLARENIWYPAETLSTKQGDCGDLAILFSALLESVGIKTRLISIKEHMLMSYYNKESWIPIDTVDVTSLYNLDTAKTHGLERLKAENEITDVEEEWSKGIIPPNSINVGSLNFNDIPLISVLVSQDGLCSCAIPDLLGCLSYQIQISCTYTFTNLGESDGNKCIMGEIRLNGQSVKEEQICTDVSAKQTETKMLEYVKEVSDCGSVSYSCTYK